MIVRLSRSFDAVPNIFCCKAVSSIDSSSMEARLRTSWSIIGESKGGTEKLIWVIKFHKRLPCVSCLWRDLIL